MLRAHRDNDGEWWLDRMGVGVYPPRWADGKCRTHDLNELEPEIADRLAKLLFLDPGQSLPEVGRRIDEKTFWIFYDE